jgi:hypothetical protein
MCRCAFKLDLLARLCSSKNFDWNWKIFRRWYFFPSIYYYVKCTICWNLNAMLLKFLIIVLIYGQTLNRQIQSTTGKLWKRNDPDLVQTFLKKWWVESDFKAPNLPLSLRLKSSGLIIVLIYGQTFSDQMERRILTFLLWQLFYLFYSK